MGLWGLSPRSAFLLAAVPSSGGGAESRNRHAAGETPKDRRQVVQHRARAGAEPADPQDVRILGVSGGALKARAHHEHHIGRYGARSLAPAYGKRTGHADGNVVGT